MDRRLELGLVLTGVVASTMQPREQLSDALALTRSARDNGYAVLAVGQHFLGFPYQYLQPIPLLGRLSAESGNMLLATGVLLLPLLHPVDVAEQLATLDTICDGRLVVAIGIGYRDEEFAAFGIDRGTRADRMLESLQVVRRLWSGEAVDHNGRFFHLRAARTGIRPIRQDGPEVWIAGMTSGTVARATTLGYKPFIGPRASLPQVRRWVAAFRASSGDPAATLPVRRDVFVAPSAADARELALRHTGERLAAYRRWGMRRGLDTAMDADALAAEQVIAGDAEGCAETLRGYAEAGASPIVLRVQWPELHVNESLRMIDELARRD